MVSGPATAFHDAGYHFLVFFRVVIEGDARACVIRAGIGLCLLGVIIFVPQLVGHTVSGVSVFQTKGRVILRLLQELLPNLGRAKVVERF